MWAFLLLLGSMARAAIVSIAAERGAARRPER
jgi:hypothetical protein